MFPQPGHQHPHGPPSMMASSGLAPGGLANGDTVQLRPIIDSTLATIQSQAVRLLQAGRLQNEAQAGTSSPVVGTPTAGVVDPANDARITALRAVMAHQRLNIARLAVAVRWAAGPDNGQAASLVETQPAPEVTREPATLTAEVTDTHPEGDTLQTPMVEDAPPDVEPLRLPTVVECREHASTLSHHSTVFAMTADLLHQVNTRSQQMRVPHYDVETAVDVLAGSGHPTFPAFVRENFVGSPSVLAPSLGSNVLLPIMSVPTFQEDLAQSLTRERLLLVNATVTVVLRRRLAESILPPGLQFVSMRRGSATFEAPGLFRMKLSLDPVHSSLPWRIDRLWFTMDVEAAADGRSATAKRKTPGQSGSRDGLSAGAGASTTGSVGHTASGATTKGTKAFPPARQVHLLPPNQCQNLAKYFTARIRLLGNNRLPSEVPIPELNELNYAHLIDASLSVTPAHFRASIAVIYHELTLLCMIMYIRILRFQAYGLAAQGWRIDLDLDGDSAFPSGDSGPAGPKRALEPTSARALDAGRAGPLGGSSVKRLGIRYWVERKAGDGLLPMRGSHSGQASARGASCHHTLIIRIDQPKPLQLALSTAYCPPAGAASPSDGTLAGAGASPLSMEVLDVAALSNHSIRLVLEHVTQAPPGDRGNMTPAPGAKPLAGVTSSNEVGPGWTTASDGDEDEGDGEENSDDDGLSDCSDDGESEADHEREGVAPLRGGPRHTSNADSAEAVERVLRAARRHGPGGLGGSGVGPSAGAGPASLSRVRTLSGPEFDLSPTNGQLSMERVLRRVVGDQCVGLIHALRQMLINPLGGRLREHAGLAFDRKDVIVCEDRVASGLAGNQAAGSRSEANGMEVSGPGRRVSLHVHLYEHRTLDISVEPTTGRVTLVLAGSERRRLLRDVAQVEAALNGDKVLATGAGANAGGLAPGPAGPGPESQAAGTSGRAVAGPGITPQGPGVVLSKVPFSTMMSRAGPERDAWASAVVAQLMSLRRRTLRDYVDHITTELGLESVAHLLPQVEVPLPEELDPVGDQLFLRFRRYPEYWLAVHHIDRPTERAFLLRVIANGPGAGVLRVQQTVQLLAQGLVDHSAGEATHASAPDQALRRRFSLWARAACCLIGRDALTAAAVARGVRSIPRALADWLDAGHEGIYARVGRSPGPPDATGAVTASRAPVVATTVSSTVVPSLPAGTLLAGVKDGPEPGPSTRETFHLSEQDHHAAGVFRFHGLLGQLGDLVGGMALLCYPPEVRVMIQRLVRQQSPGREAGHIEELQDRASGLIAQAGLIGPLEVHVQSTGRAGGLAGCGRISLVAGAALVHPRLWTDQSRRQLQRLLSTVVEPHAIAPTLVTAGFEQPYLRFPPVAVEDAEGLVAFFEAYRSSLCMAALVCGLALAEMDVDAVVPASSDLKVVADPTTSGPGFPRWLRRLPVLTGGQLSFPDQWDCAEGTPHGRRVRRSWAAVRFAGPVLSVSVPRVRAPPSPSLDSVPLVATVLTLVPEVTETEVRFRLAVAPTLGEDVGVPGKRRLVDGSPSAAKRPRTVGDPDPLPGSSSSSSSDGHYLDMVLPLLEPILAFSRKSLADAMASGAASGALATPLANVIEIACTVEPVYAALGRLEQAVAFAQLGDSLQGGLVPTSAAGYATWVGAATGSGAFARVLSSAPAHPSFPLRAPGALSFDPATATVPPLAGSPGARALPLAHAALVLRTSVTHGMYFRFEARAPSPLHVRLWLGPHIRLDLDILVEGGFYNGPLGSAASGELLNRLRQPGAPALDALGGRVTVRLHDAVASVSPSMLNAFGPSVWDPYFDSQELKPALVLVQGIPGQSPGSRMNRRFISSSKQRQPLPSFLSGERIKSVLRSTTTDVGLFRSLPGLRTILQTPRPSPNVTQNSIPYEDTLSHQVLQHLSAPLQIRLRPDFMASDLSTSDPRLAAGAVKHGANADLEMVPAEYLPRNIFSHSSPPPSAGRGDGDSLFDLLKRLLSFTNWGVQRFYSLEDISILLDGTKMDFNSIDGSVRLRESHDPERPPGAGSAVTSATLALTIPKPGQAQQELLLHHPPGARFRLLARVPDSGGASATAIPAGALFSPFDSLPSGAAFVMEDYGIRLTSIEPGGNFVSNNIATLMRSLARKSAQATTPPSLYSLSVALSLPGHILNELHSLLLLEETSAKSDTPNGFELLLSVPDLSAFGANRTPLVAVQNILAQFRERLQSRPAAFMTAVTQTYERYTQQRVQTGFPADRAAAFGDSQVPNPNEVTMAFDRKSQTLNLVLFFYQKAPKGSGAPPTDGCLVPLQWNCVDNSVQVSLACNCTQPAMPLMPQELIASLAARVPELTPQQMAHELFEMTHEFRQQYIQVAMRQGPLWQQVETVQAHLRAQRASSSSQQPVRSSLLEVVNALVQSPFPKLALFHGQFPAPPGGGSSGGAPAAMIGSAPGAAIVAAPVPPAPVSATPAPAGK
ncbi:hypothetical protein H696_01124 [Fonticula alba]|uniref:Mediator of RNA polymerase II transcription subunit 14 n=1 Tax=Fonticula alba TaxID=691883 RepID=A0A058ZCN5_FONAL|nr:hypothetical protein H696_01124 [Fonticula alba]KCV71701.1 hypothetical protein H696_01124 [Fonticula alba]|eukprot:XP_009493279.1 hypothetical protein H696_01124 [Fonticula alba]